MMAKKRPSKVSEQLREAIESSGMSRYEIAKGASIDESALGKFFHGERGLSLSALDRLAEFLDLELRPRQQSRKAKG